MRLKDKVIIVTGAAGGLGREFALRLAQEGAAVAVSDIQDCGETVKLVQSAGGACIGIQTDVSCYRSAEAMADEVYSKLGGIHGLVNNAAIYASLKMESFDKISGEDWDRVFDVNVKGVWHCCKAVYPYMKENGGSIVNISSASILEGNPFFAHYVASKGAVWALTRSISRDAGAYNIRVNSVTPGYTMTDASKGLAGNPESFRKNYDDNIAARALKRSMEPEDVTGAVLFLLSDEAAFVTGQNINVDGGSRHY